MSIIKSLSKHLIATLVFSPMLITSCGDNYRQSEGMIWHTTYHITYNSDKELGDSIMSTLKVVDNSLNFFNPNSLLSKVNSSDSIRVDTHLQRVYETSIEVNRISNGMFDPTLGPLIDAWGFGKGHKATKDTLHIDSLLNFTGIAKSKIENGILIKPCLEMVFNFSGVAKGYGCDAVAEMFKRNGVTDYLVEIGGEIRSGGKSPKNNCWKISIDKPILTDSVLHESQCIIEIENAGIATSGNYRNFQTSGGVVYGHTISATTGRPAKTDILSATVVMPDACQADAMATALMAMGATKGKKLASQLKLPVMMVINTGEVWETEEFKLLQSK